MVKFDQVLKFTCPSCGGKWKRYEDAKQCHGIAPCNRSANCEALTHFGSCKSMKSTMYYSLDQIKELAREWSNTSWSDDPVTAIEQDLSVGLTLSAFLAWLAKREQGEVRGR